MERGREKKKGEWPWGLVGVGRGRESGGRSQGQTAGLWHPGSSKTWSVLGIAASPHHLQLVT